MEESKENVIVVDVFSFEFALLSFENLTDWVFAKEDELKDKRQEVLELRELFVKVMMSDGTLWEAVTADCFRQFPLPDRAA